MADPEDRESTTGMPRWVKVFGVIAVVLVLALVILFFASGGEHGPRRHIPGNGGGQTTPGGGQTSPPGHTSPGGG